MPNDFWINRYKRQAEYERATFTAQVTGVWPDGTVDVEVSSTGARFYDVNNGTPYQFSIGDMVVLTRLGGGRGNRHVVIAPAGRSASIPMGGGGGSGGGGGGGGSTGGATALSEVVVARNSDVYGALSSLDARLEAGDGEVYDARSGAASLSARLADMLSSPQFTGTPRADRYEVHDAAKFITFDADEMTFTDAVAGTKTLSELAAGGGGADTKQVLISADDTTEKYLEDAITTSGGVTKSTTSPGGNEKLDLAVHAQSHALADSSALGADHTVSGLTAGHVLTALTATTAAFQAAAGGGGAHDLLSATHADTTAAAVVRGDIITGQGATPKWVRLAVGASGTYLAGGTEPAWATLNQAAVAGPTTASTPTFAGLSLGTGGLNTVGTITPAADSTYNLGTSGPLYFANAYIDKVWLNATAALDGATAGTVNVTGYLRLPNNTPLQMKDVGGTARHLLWIDASTPASVILSGAAAGGVIAFQIPVGTAVGQIAAGGGNVLGGFRIGHAWTTPATVTYYSADGSAGATGAFQDVDYTVHYFKNGLYVGT